MWHSSDTNDMRKWIFFCTPVKKKSDTSESITRRERGEESRRRATRERSPPRSHPLHSSPPCHCRPCAACYGHKCACCPRCPRDGFLCQLDGCSECWLITRHMHSPPIHGRHISGTNQEPERDNVSWRTTGVLITDTLSHAYWSSPGGIRQICWICRTEARWSEHLCNSKGLLGCFNTRGCVGVIGDVNEPGIWMH